MDQCTENYECLVIHNNSKSNRLEDQVFWYRADMHSDFQVGHPSAWKYHISNYDEYHDNDDDDFDISKCKSKKGPVVNVKKTY